MTNGRLVLLLTFLAAPGACAGGGATAPADAAAASQDSQPISDGPSPLSDTGTEDAGAADVAPAAPDQRSDGSGPPDTSSAGPLDIRGIYLVGSPHALNDGSLATALSAAGIDGLLIVTHWSDLTTSLKTYDWHPIDAQARLAADRGLKFELSIILGGSAPAWLFAAPPAGLGATPVNLQYADKAGANGRCLPVTEARPWDPIFLDALDDLLAQLARHLTEAGLYGRLSMLRLTAINGWTDELRLPAQTPKTIALPCITDSVQLWTDAGFRPSVLLGGWKLALAHYRQHFPDKFFNVALIQGGSLPPIHEDGSPAVGGTAPAVVTELVTALVSGAAQALPGRLVIQENGLVADAPPAMLVTTTAAQTGAPFAWQTNEWLGLAGGGACGGSFSAPVLCTATSFHALTWNGIHPPGASTQARYLELFPPNTAAFPAETRLAHDELLK
jgi:hypothetical protein